MAVKHGVNPTASEEHRSGTQQGEAANEGNADHRQNRGLRN
jgi:hypothetical protein